MQFHANHVSTSTFAGDYYQAMFEADEQAHHPHSPYLLIQRQFEDPDDHLCYVETHDEKYIGHFFLRRVEFTLHGLSIELDRPNDNLLNVTFTMAPYSIKQTPNAGDEQMRVIDGNAPRFSTPATQPRNSELLHHARIQRKSWCRAVLPVTTLI